MGETEIDTKPFEPVRVLAHTLFGEKRGPRKRQSGDCTDDEMKKEKDVKGLLANYKVQIEAKDSACIQLLLMLEYCQNSTEELSALLKNSEIERNILKEHCIAARVQINELEAKIKTMSNELLETEKIRQNLLSEAKATREEILCMEIEIAAARKAALTPAELMETAANMEKEGPGNHQVAELNEAIHVSKLAAIEAGKEQYMVSSEKDVQYLESAMETAAQVKEQVKNMKKQLEVMLELETQLLSESMAIEYLQVEFHQAYELLSSSNKAVSDVVQDLTKLKADLDVKGRGNLDQAVYIRAMKTELDQLKLELKNANEEVIHLNSNVEILIDELRKVKKEMDELEERESERSELASAKARDHGSGKSRSFFSIQQLAVKAEEAMKVIEEPEEFGPTTAQYELSCQAIEVFEKNETNDEESKEGIRNGNGGNITISLDECESLMGKAEKSDDCNQPMAFENQYEMEILKKELEAANVRIGEFRTRAEQAITRADAADRDKTILADQVKRQEEQKHRRKAAIMALREECSSREFSFSTFAPKKYRPQPLGRVLNMKF